MAKNNRAENYRSPDLKRDLPEREERREAFEELMRRKKATSEVAEERQFEVIYLSILLSELGAFVS